MHVQPTRCYRNNLHGNKSVFLCIWNKYQDYIYMVLTNCQQWCNFVHHCIYNEVSIIESCTIQRIIISLNPHIPTKRFCKYLYSHVFVINITSVNVFNYVGMAVIPICFMGIPNFYIRTRVKVYKYIQQYYNTHV